jgi:hypothetical protein
MHTVYSAVVAVILLFPWSLVALMAVGALRERQKMHVRVRVRRQA